MSASNVILYSLDELVSKKMPKAHRDQSLVPNLVTLEFKFVGEEDKDYFWAKKHMKYGDERLDWYNLFSFTKEQHEAFKKAATDVLKRQLGVSKTAALRELQYFDLEFGFPTDDPDRRSYPWSETLCDRIYEYEKGGAKIEFDDGFEDELKRRIKYDEYLAKK